MKNRFLSNTPLFAVLDDQEREALSSRLVLRHYADGEPLFKQGKAAGEMFLVKSGMVRLVEHEPSSDRVLATFGPSSVLGEVDLLLGRPYGSTALAQGEVDAWVLDREGLAAAMAAQPTMSIKLSSFLGERIADVDQYLVNRLRRISILSDLDDESLGALARVLELRDVRRGALIFQAGVQAEHLFFVESGTVTIVSVSPDDPEPFRQLGPGEVFGHEALLRGRQYGAVARAATDVQLWSLDRAAYERVATQHPALRQALAAHVSENALAPADRAAAREALARVPLFAGLSDALLDLLVSRLTLQHVGTNETIYTAGDPGDALFLIDHGVVKLLDAATLVERKESGDFFGELALLTGKPRTYTARAARATNLWVLLKRDFDSIAVRYPELTTAVSRVLAQMLARETDQEAQAEIQLSMFPLFTGLTPHEQSDVARRLRAMTVRSNEIIFRQGAVPDAFYLVRRGQVKLASQQGIFDLVRTGGFFGEMALLTGNYHNVTAQAVEDTELLLLDRAHFDAVLSRYPSVSLALSRALSNRLEAANARGSLPVASPSPATRATPAATPRPTPAARDGDGAVPPVPPAGAMAPARPRARSPWARVKLLLVLLPLLWLAGVTAPTLLLNAAAADEASPLRSLLLIGTTPTVVPTALPEATIPPEAPAEQAPAATPPPSHTPDS